MLHVHDPSHLLFVRHAEAQTKYGDGVFMLDIKGVHYQKVKQWTAGKLNPWAKLYDDGRLHKQFSRLLATRRCNYFLKFIPRKRTLLSREGSR